MTRLCIKGMFATLLGLAVAVSAQAFPGEDALYEAAKKEGEVMVYTAHYNTEQITELCKGFDKRYAGVKCNFIRQTAQVTFRRLAQDKSAGLKVCDVISTTDLGHYPKMKKDGWLIKYKPASLANMLDNFKPYNDPEGYYHITSAGLVIINYNTTMISEADAPKKWTDLLDPKWKDKISIGHPGFSGYVGTWVVLMRKMYGWDYFEKLEKNNPQIGRSINDTVTMLNAKERAVGAGPSATTLRSKDKGNPLGVIYPEDGALLMIAPTGITNDAPHPNAAKLFVEYLLSVEAGNIQLQQRGEAVMKGATPPPGAKTLDQVNTTRPTLEELIKGIPEVKESFRDTFGI